MTKKAKSQKPPKISLQLGEQMIEQLRLLAKESGVSMSEYVRYHLEDPITKGAVLRKSVRYLPKNKKTQS